MRRMQNFYHIEYRRHADNMGVITAVDDFNTTFAIKIIATGWRHFEVFKLVANWNFKIFHELAKHK